MHPLRIRCRRDGRTVCRRRRMVRCVVDRLGPQEAGLLRRGRRWRLCHARACSRCVVDGLGPQGAGLLRRFKHKAVTRSVLVLDATSMPFPSGAGLLARRGQKSIPNLLTSLNRNQFLFNAKPLGFRTFRSRLRLCHDRHYGVSTTPGPLEEGRATAAAVGARCANRSCTICMDKTLRTARPPVF